MLFNSVGFLLCFLPVFIIIYKLVPARFRNIVLLLGSFIFYVIGEPRYLPLFFAMTVINYVLGLFLEPYAPARRKSTADRQIKEQSRQERVKERRMRRRYETRRKVFLTIGVAGNAFILLGFKVYSGEKGVPLGLSFYAFSMLSYFFDIYRGEVKREKSFLCFSTYALMFPKMTSGPIATYESLRSKLHKRDVTMESIKKGLQIFTMGLAAKVLLADRLGILWHDVQVIGFESISTPLAWMTAIAFSCKLYFDFYGYSLMAVGLGEMLGFSLPQNFDNPYMARSVREFYRRWHMTLGQWFTKYIYIPFGGSRAGRIRTIINLLIVWGLTSVWHGFGVNFLLWGMMLCLLIILERTFGDMGAGKIFNKGILKAVPHLYLWFVIPITWMCFAIADAPSLQIYLNRMFGVSAGIQVDVNDWLKKLQDYWYLFAISLVACTPVVQKVFRKWRDTLPGYVILTALFWYCIWKIQTEGQNPFLYFKF